MRYYFISYELIGKHHDPKVTLTKGHVVVQIRTKSEDVIAIFKTIKADIKEESKKYGEDLTVLVLQFNRVD